MDFSKFLTPPAGTLSKSIADIQQSIAELKKASEALNAAAQNLTHTQQNTTQKGTYHPTSYLPVLDLEHNSILKSANFKIPRFMIFEDVKSALQKYAFDTHQLIAYFEKDIHLMHLDPKDVLNFQNLDLQKKVELLKQLLTGSLLKDFFTFQPSADVTLGVDFKSVSNNFWLQKISEAILIEVKNDSSSILKNLLAACLQNQNLLKKFCHFLCTDHFALDFDLINLMAEDLIPALEKQGLETELDFVINWMDEKNTNARIFIFSEQKLLSSQTQNTLQKYPQLLEGQIDRSERHIKELLEKKSIQTKDLDFIINHAKEMKRNFSSLSQRALEMIQRLIMNHGESMNQSQLEGLICCFKDDLDIKNIQLTYKIFKLLSRQPSFFIDDHNHNHENQIDQLLLKNALAKIAQRQIIKHLQENRKTSKADINAMIFILSTIHQKFSNQGDIERASVLEMALLSTISNQAKLDVDTYYLTLNQYNIMQYFIERVAPYLENLKNALKNSDQKINYLDLGDILLGVTQTELSETPTQKSWGHLTTGLLPLTFVEVTFIQCYIFYPHDYEIAKIKNIFTQELEINFDTSPTSQYTQRQENGADLFEKFNALRKIFNEKVERDD